MYAEIIALNHLKMHILKSKNKNFSHAMKFVCVMKYILSTSFEL